MKIIILGTDNCDKNKSSCKKFEKIVQPTCREGYVITELNECIDRVDIMENRSIHTVTLSQYIILHTVLTSSCISSSHNVKE